MLVLVVDRSKIACETMCKYLEALGYTAIAVNSVEDAVETLTASFTWSGMKFSAIILTADASRKMPVLWFLKYLNNRRNELGVTPVLLQSDHPLYEAEGDTVDLSTLSARQFPFVWYHTMDLKKMRYFQQFFKERVKSKGPAR
jgi:CheY-like chemotaxis protein